MSKSLVEKINDLAGAMGADQLRQDAFIAKIAPPDADVLTGKVLVMAGTSKKSGYLAADPAATYKAGTGAGDQVNYLINDAVFTLSTPDTDTAVNAGDEGLLELHINDVLVDSFDLAAVFNPANESGNQSWTPANSPASKITVTSVGVYNNIWQKLNARLNIAATDLRKGYNRVVLKHTGIAAGEQVAQAYEVFYDDATTNPVMSAVVMAIHSEVPKFLSGVKYLGNGSMVKVSTTIANMADNSYVSNPVEFYGLKGANTTTVAPDDGVVSGLSNPPAVGENMVITDKVIVLNSANQCDADGRITGRPRDPFGAYGTVTSASQNILISTFSNRANATTEYFDDEAYRLPLSWNSDDKTSPLTGNWDSTALLGASDAQQFISTDNEHSLMYPAINFSNGYQPDNAANYSGHAGDQQYLRGIQGSAAKSSIQLVLNGLTGGIGQIGSGDVNVEIKLPGVGGWWDCAKPFPGSLGTTDGDGCLNGAISYSGGKATINATFGTNSSFNSNNRLYVRITLRNGNRIIKSISTNW